MKIEKKEKKLIAFSDELGVKTGILFEDLHAKEVTSRERWITCLWKGLIIFLCAYGTLGLWITSFELPCDQVTLFLAVLFMSFIVAVLYHNKVSFNIGYIVLLIVFCMIATIMVRYANSGINAILNIAIKMIDEKLNLDGVREYTEMIQNRKLTITACLFLMSFLSLCFLNSIVSGYMNALMVLVHALPTLQVCMYFDDSLNILYLCMTLCGYILLLFFRRSNAFAAPFEKRIINVKNHKNTIIHKSANAFTNIKHTVRFALILLIGMILLCGMLVVATPKTLRNNKSTWKAGVDTFVEEFAMNGFGSFFNQYEARGGMSGGKLGGVRQVSMDFETDLRVSFVPYSYETLYLKGFVGEVYKDNQWSYLQNHVDLTKGIYRFSNFSVLVNKESDRLKAEYEYGKTQSAKGKIQITNIDADEKYFYYPYYATVNSSDVVSYNIAPFSADLVLGGMETNRTYVMEYYPLFQDYSAWDGVNSVEALYRIFAYSNYLFVPTVTERCLSEVCDKYITSDTLEGVINDIRMYFYKNFHYTLSPGITPSKKDFVQYFVTKQKKGYCTHFATTGAMLLRMMGYPARYVEGYAIDVSELDDAELLDVEIAEWYDGYNLLTSDLEADASVLRIDVTDASAHAWVEVYVNGFGWMPVEFTIAEQEESNDRGSFWERFGRLFDDGNDMSYTPIENITNQIQSSIPTMLIVFAILVGLGGVTLYGIWFYKRARVYYIKGNRRLILQYAVLTHMLVQYDYVEKENLYYYRTRQLLGEVIHCEMQMIEEYLLLVERASYGKDEVSTEELTLATQHFRYILGAIACDLPKRKSILLRIMY